MKKILLAGSILLAATSAYAKNWCDPNCGKADNYGSESFRAVNHCMVQAIQSGKTPMLEAALETCMGDLGFSYLPNAQIFGNAGPKCKTQKGEGTFHSWCWGHLE
jgi:hypothetical protein